MLQYPWSSASLFSVAAGCRGGGGEADKAKKRTVALSRRKDTGIHGARSCSTGKGGRKEGGGTQVNGGHTPEAVHGRPQKSYWSPLAQKRKQTGELKQPRKTQGGTFGGGTDE